MSEGAQQPQRPNAPPARTASSANLRVMTASRAAPPPKEPDPPISKRLQSEATNAALNFVSIVKETVEDFRRRDRFFKYKALIAASWFALSATSIGVACQQQGLEVGDLGARVVLGPPERPSVLIFNESDEPWLDVTFVVNKEYRASMERVEPGAQITLTPKQLLGRSGQTAPSDMPMRDLEIRTEDGDAMLLENGEVP